MTSTIVDIKPVLEIHERGSMTSTLVDLTTSTIVDAFPVIYSGYLFRSLRSQRL